MRRLLVVAPGLVVVGVVGALWYQPASCAEDALGAGGAGPLRYLAIGGGALPASTEVSLEQDLTLARQTLPGPGAVLFGGGPRARSVRVLDPTHAVDEQDLRLRLGDLFSPRAGRRSHFRKSTLPVAGAASRVEVEQHLRRALSQPGTDPLLLYVAAHGEQRDAPSDNEVVLWAAEALTPRGLAALHDESERPLHTVITSCFSGGFAELAFAGADATRGPTRAPRCGLFAGPWDRQTSGCDPNPDRRSQESYGIHMLNALSGRDRAGRPLPLRELDYDGDGHLSLLEAHTRARIAAMTIDVPTTTSERFLREVQQVEARAPEHSFPEEDAVIAQLGVALELQDIEDARAALETARQRLDALDVELSAREREVDERYWALAARLLARYPVLDDAFHPRFDEVLAEHGDAIRNVLDAAPEARAFADANRELAKLDRRMWQLQIREARVFRYVRAQQTRALASALSERGGPDHAAYRRLLTCERYPYGEDAGDERRHAP